MRSTVISTEIGSIAKIIGEEKAVELVAKAGFDAWDFSMFVMCRYDWEQRRCLENDHPVAGKNYLQFARQLRKIGEDHGIYCNQSHAPFPVHVPDIRSSLKGAIECTAEAGGHLCVIHPMNNGTLEENVELYLSLLPFAKEHDVRIATENMWSWDKEKDQAAFAACATPESFCAHVDGVNDPYLVACLDIGHAQMRGLNTSAPEMIQALGNRLQALHIHDNDCWHDSHMLPFTMDIDFEEVAQALKEIDYQGDFTLEASHHISGRAEEDVFRGVQEMAKATRKFADMCK